MHSTQGPSGQWYQHNGDFSGPIVITDLDTAINNEYGYPRIEIPFEDIRAIYLRYARSKMISELEQASDDDLEADWVGIAQEPRPTVFPKISPVPTPEAQEREQAARWTREFLRDSESYKWVRIGSIYIHSERPWVLARVEEVPVDGSVHFSVWNPLQGYDWQGGAGLKSQDSFMSLYPLKYTGPAPETLRIGE
jgi:hypothetical protein